MAIYSSAVSNSADIGNAFSNLAQMFAPPASGDLANYALARGRNQQSDIIAQLQKDPKYAGFDQQAILADLYDPTSSFYKVNTDDATTRRGQDITANTSITNNTADNQRAFATSMLGPVSQDAMRPAVPSAVSDMFGMPALPQVNGLRSPLSETQVMGGNTQRLIDQGDITDQNLVTNIMSDAPVENIVGPDGKPQTVNRSDAVGQQPYFNKGAEAKPENAIAQLADGTTVTAIQADDGSWNNAQTGAKLPNDIQIFKVPAPQGSASDVGLGKTTTNYIDRSLLDIAVTKDTAVKLRDLIAKAPASQGAVGFLRGTAQNMLQVGGEVGTFFGGQVKEVTDAIASGAANADLAGAFDPSLPAIDFMANLLAFQYAKTTTGDRLSNEMLKAARSALGLEGLDANQASSLARLDQAIAQIESQQKILQRAKDEGTSALATPAADGAATEVPADWTGTPDEWGYLTPQEQDDYNNGQ